MRNLQRHLINEETINLTYRQLVTQDRSSALICS